jgi:sulfur carrier protein
MISIVVNGEKVQMRDEVNIEDMITLLGYKEKSFAVAINNTFVPLDEYRECKIKDGDSIEILAPMVGG